MSRLGNKIISIPAGVTVTVDNKIMTVTGPKGTLSRQIADRIVVEVVDSEIKVRRLGEDKKTRSNHGTTWSHLNNMIKGVLEPWKKELEIRGTGYKASLSGNKLTVLAGYIHPVFITAPEGVQISVPEETKIVVTGCDKTIVGQVASNIRKIRKPEVYKGKGIRYVNEFIKLKAGKTAKA